MSEIEDDMIHQFDILYQQQEIIASLVNEDLYKNLGNSESHCLSFIGRYKEVNGVEIASGLEMTRGAISKITNQLIKKGYIETSKKPDNKKEIYYSLTTEGHKLHKKHITAHEKWIKRDKAFLNSVSSQDKKTILLFLEEFNKNIFNNIEEIK